MREFVATLLVGAILTCPFICGAGEVDHGERGHDPVAGTRSDPGFPVHCPDEGGNCLCEGAVKPVEIKADKQLLDFKSPGFPCLADFAVRPTAGWADGLARLSPLAKLRRGDATSVRALLQNFRC